jgi:hypothetical protein
MRCTACHRKIKRNHAATAAPYGPDCARRLGVLLPVPERPAKAATAPRVRLPKVKASEADPAQLELAFMP